MYLHSLVKLKGKSVWNVDKGLFLITLELSYWMYSTATCRLTRVSASETANMKIINQLGKTFTLASVTGGGDLQEKKKSVVVYFQMN